MWLGHVDWADEVLKPGCSVESELYMAMPFLFLTRFKPRYRRRFRAQGERLGGWEQLGCGESLRFTSSGVESLESRVLMAADLAVDISDSHAFYSPATQITYSVVVNNIGDLTATAATVATSLASGITQQTWTAAYFGGASGPAVGAGNLSATNATITVPAGGSAAFTIVATIGPNATGPLTSTASVSLASDAHPTNNAASDTNAFVPKAIVLTDDAGWTSTSTVRVVSPTTGAVLSQFDAIQQGYRGGMHAAMGDLEGNGNTLIVTAPGRGAIGQIRVFTLAGIELPEYRTLPFGAQWRGGVNLAVGDVDGDGRDDLIASRAIGNGEVKIFRSVAGADPILDAAYRSFVPFGQTFVGGASVAAADMGTFASGNSIDTATPDGKVEVVVGRGLTAAPLVRVYDVSPAVPAVVDTIRPFTGSRSLGGVSVAAGRVNTDSIADIIVSSGLRGDSKTEVYNGLVGVATNPLLARFAAFSDLASRPNAPAFGALIDLSGAGTVSTLYSVQGTGSGSSGVKTVSTAGVVTGTLGSFTGPLLIAAPVAKTNTGIVTTPSGLQYRDLVVGSGAKPSSSAATVGVKYEGWLLSGARFDGNANASFLVSGVIAGWREALLTMNVGTRRQLIIPPALAYGASGSPPSIPSNATLVFDVELLSTT